MDTDDGNNTGEEQTITIIIILIAAVVVFFLVIAWCGFFYGLWRNTKIVAQLSRTTKYQQQLQYRRQQRQKHQQQQLNPSPQQLLQQQEQQYPPQLQQQLQQQSREQQLRQQHNANRSRQLSQQSREQQLRQQHNANRSRLLSQLSSNTSHTDFTHQLNSHPSAPHHGEIVSVHSGYLTPAAVAVPVYIPERDYDDITPLHGVNASSTSSPTLDHSYHNRTFDYFEATGSPNHSFTNIGYQSNASYPDRAAGFNNSQGYSPAPPRSTSTPLVPKMQAKHKRTSQPSSFQNYSMEMQQYQQLQNWPQNY